MMHEAKETNGWNNTFFLFDIEVIDNQHKVLFEMLDSLIELNSTTDSQDLILKIIDNLTDYTDYHFNTEEDLMKSAMSTDIESHLRQHVFFKNQVKEFRRMYAYHNQALAGLMIDFLRNWFLIHIYDIDRQYVESVKQYLEGCEEDK